MGVLRVNMAAEATFAMPENWHMHIPLAECDGQHVEILQNATNAIIKGEELLSPAEEGIHGVELANIITDPGTSGLNGAGKSGG